MKCERDSVSQFGDFLNPISNGTIKCFHGTDTNADSVPTHSDDDGSDNQAGGVMCFHLVWLFELWPV
ncbi:hypothetical protein EBR25_10940 [bacterium]|nr:hypothetical protein [bacterium]